MDVDLHYAGGVIFLDEVIHLCYLFFGYFVRGFLLCFSFLGVYDR